MLCFICSSVPHHHLLIIQIGNAGGTHGACMTDNHCQNDGECCVDYHVGYCGVPSDCNEFLKCRGAGSAPFTVSAMSDTPATNEEFQALLARADGGGAYYDGCPPRSETWEGYLVSSLKFALEKRTTLHGLQMPSIVSSDLFDLFLHYVH